MGQLAKTITLATQRVQGLGTALLKDVDPLKAAHFPAPGGNPIDCNHPVFVYGHLSIYPQRLIGLLGGDPSSVAVPESYATLFAAGVECQNDPKNSIYPPLDEVLKNYTRAYQGAIEFVKGLSDEKLAQDIEAEGGFKDAFTTNAVMAMFLIHDHQMFHFGQVSTWRRAMGLGSAM